MQAEPGVFGRIVGALALALLSARGIGDAQPTALVGGTLIDVANFGHSTHDIAGAIVVIDNGKILAAGPSGRVTIPPGARRIDVGGKYLIPGLIDGFGALRAQSFASAYLYDGVTSVYVPTIVSGGGGDGETKIVRDAAPGPRLLLGAPITGYSEDGADPSDHSMAALRLHGTRLSNAQLVARIDRLADGGYRGITIGYDVWPDQVDVAIAEARRRGLATLGEPAFTSYPYEIRAGIDALVHDDHYQVELAPAVAKLARADDLSTAVDAYRAMCTSDPASSVVTEYAKQLAASHAALMPTLAVEATADALDVPNPWDAPSAKLIAASDLDSPVDRTTGESGWLHGMAPDRVLRVRACARHKEQIDARFYQFGAKFLAGSAATTYGIMPGSGLHLELALLHRIGLTPREALAAATSNFADVYGWPDIGRIEAGRDADVVVLDGDPRADVSAVDRIDRLFFRGDLIDRSHLLSGPVSPSRPPVS